MTPRTDLLALTLDDLCVLANRGTVQRARQELKASELSCTWTEVDGVLVAAWSNGVTCRFRPGLSIHQAECSSQAVGISRHVIRSILDYQQRFQQPRADCPETVPFRADPLPVEGQVPSQVAPEGMSEAGLPAMCEASAWDPGTISDKALAECFGKASITRARKLFGRGVIAELQRGPKPLCRFLHEPCSVRFLVPGDLRYVQADCTETLRATYIPWAVWMFRALALDRDSGIVSIGERISGTPVELLDEIEALVLQLVAEGLQGLPSTYSSQVKRLIDQLREQNLVWPAEVFADLLQQWEAYHSHDASFDPICVADHLAELLIRTDAIRSERGVIPRMFVQGNRSEIATQVAYGRFVGLGCGVRRFGKSIELTAFLQELDSGSLAAVDRRQTDPEPVQEKEVPPSFAKLARERAGMRVSLYDLGQGQLLTSGKLTPARRLILPQGQIRVNPQTFAWEKLRPPVLVDSFRKAAERLQSLPPRSLRPRKLTEDFVVLQPEATREVVFNRVSQEMTLPLNDASGVLVHVRFPYLSRNRGGFDRLTTRLQEPESKLKFVAGHLRPSSLGLIIVPTAVVFERRGDRSVIQPWVELEAGEHSDLTAAWGVKRDTPVQDSLQRLGELLGEVVRAGINKLSPQAHQRWRECAEDAARAGFVRWPRLVGHLANYLEEKREKRDQSATSILQETRTLMVLWRLFNDLAL